MKGHTKIELKDVKTGKVQVIDEDNMVTLGLQKMLQPLPFTANNIAATSKIIGDVVGGLLLFEDAIEENVNNYLPPAGNKMTGRGMHDKVYTGEVLELGSFNIAESGLQDDGSVKLVWDFNTSQANGKISCVSLTSLCGGLVGLGDSAEASVTASQFKRIANIGVYGVSPNRIVFVSADHVLIQSLLKEVNTGTTGEISFTNARLPLFNVSIFDKCSYLNNTGGENYEIRADKNKKEGEDFTVTLPQKVIDTFVGSNESSFYFRGGYVSFFADGIIRYVFGNYSANIPDKGMFYLCEINAKTGELKVKDITNTTGGEISLGGKKWLNFADNPSIDHNKSIAVTSKYIICPSCVAGAWKLYRININNNTDVVDLEFTISSDTAIHFFMITEEKIFFSYNDRVYVIDVSNGSILNISASRDNFCDGNIVYGSQVEGYPMLMYELNYYYKNGYFAYLSVHPVPILTINNLAEPVTKTSAHTMKVTYTLSEA